MKKLTKENYKELIDKWVSGDTLDRTHEFVFHPSFVCENDIILYAFEKNIIIGIYQYVEHFRKVVFISEL